MFCEGADISEKNRKLFCFFRPCNAQSVLEIIVGSSEQVRLTTNLSGVFHLQQFHKSKFKIALTLILMSGFFAGAPQTQAARKKKSSKTYVKAYTMTGENYFGELIKSRAGELHIKQKKKRKTAKIYSVNIIEFSICNKKGAPISSDKKTLKLGLSLIKNKFGYLGTRVLGKLSSPDDKTLKKIKTAYKKAKLKLPEKFGGSEQYPRTQNCQPTSRDIIEGNHKHIDELGAKMKKINSRAHKIVTKHFIIWSTNPKSHDRKIIATHKKMYSLLSKRFQLKKGEHIWEGKLAVFACASRSDFKKMGPVLTYGSGTGSSAAGYQHNIGPLVYVSICAPRKTREDKRFYAEILTHETSHAFIARFKSHVRIRSWLNEGIAESNAGAIVKNSFQSWRIKEAAKEVKAGKSHTLMQIINARSVPLGQTSYGKAQLLVRFLMRKSPKKFVQFVDLIKQGKSEEEALQTAFGYTYDSFVKAVEKSVGKR